MRKFRFNFKIIFTGLLIALILANLLLHFTQSAQAALGINRFINFQGKLVNNPAATNVSNTSYTVVFTLYNNFSGGDVLWQETQTVTTTDGIFRVQLGSVAPIPANFNFNWSNIYLGVKVNSDAEMTPRVQLSAVPYAFNAGQVAGLTVQDSTGLASTSATLQLGNSTTPVTFNLGANNLTFTTGGTTTLTLPSTGTLLTNTATTNQTVTSTQTSGNVLSIADSTGLISAIAGLTVGLTSSTNSQNKTGISFDLSGGTGGIYYDLLGSGSTWAITRAGAFNANGAYGSLGDCLKSGGGATSAMTYGSCGTNGGGGGAFAELAGAIVPLNLTEDFLLGSQSTAGARFRVTGDVLGSGTLVVASISGNTSFAALVVNNDGVGPLFTASSSGISRFTILQNGSIDSTGTASVAGAFTFKSGGGTIQTTYNQPLTVGGATTGFIILTPNNTQTLVIAPNVLSVTGAENLSGNLNFTGSNPSITNTSANTLTINSGSTGNIQFFSSSNTLSSAGELVLAGGTGSNISLSGTTGITLSGNSAGIAFSGNGINAITTAVNQNLAINPGGFGLLGINTDGLVPRANLDIRANFGTLAVASISGSTSFATLVVDNTGVGDLFTASKSGLPLFTIKNNGNINLSSPGDITISNSGTGLTFQETGDTFGTVALSLQNRNGVNGAMFQQLGSVDLVDFVFKGLIEQRNIRFENRVTGSYQISTPEFEIGMPADPTMLISDVGVGIRKGALLIAGSWNNAATFSATLDVRNLFSGTLAVASISGSTSFASLVIDQTGAGDIFAASRSGKTLFRITNYGQLDLVGGQNTADIDTLSGTTLKIGTANATTLTLGRVGQGITLSGFTNAGGIFTTNASGNLVQTATGIAAQCLISQGTGTPTWGSCFSGAGAGNYWTLNGGAATIYPINTTLDFLWGGVASSTATFKLTGSNALAGTMSVASISGQTSYAALVVDNRIGDLITASAAGDTRFVVRQDGSVSIGNGAEVNAGFTLDVLGSARIGNNTTGDDIIKQTTSDFTQGAKCTGTNYCVTTADGVDSVSTSGDQISLVTDLIGAGGSPVAPAPGPGIGQTIANTSLTFQRPDKKFVLLNTNGTRIYDSNTNQFGGGAIFTTGTIGVGATAFQRPDGNFVVVMGNGSASQIYSNAPSASVTEIGAFAAGPALSGNVGAGSDVIRRSDGRVIVVHGGGVGTTSMYDPTTNLFSVGPAIAAAGTVTTGGFIFATPYGKWIVGLGTSTTTNIYDPSQTPGGAGGGSFVTGPSLGATSAGAGAHSLQMPDGRTLVILGGTTGTTVIYDPDTNAFSSGPPLASSQTVGAGGHSFQRSDGKWVVVLGGGSTNLQLFDPSNGANGTFSTLTGLSGAGAGTGAHTFQRPDGMYIIVHGNSQSTSTLYDGGWNTTGNWTSEDINSTKISTYSALLWSANPQSANNNARLDMETATFSAKTADTKARLATNSWVGFNSSGDLIKAVGGAAWVKIRIVFNSPVRSYQQAVTGYIFQRNIWAGEGEAFYRRSFIQPTVFSFKIINPLVSYGDPTGTGDPVFGRNFATASATLEGVVTDNSNRLTLSVNRNLPTATTSGGLIIASASANLGATAAIGTHTIERSNGTFLVIIGGTTTTRIYDPQTNTFSAGPVLPFTAGTGAHSFLMPNGQFFTVLGNTTNNTAIFDPQANQFIAGPKLWGNVGAGANTFQRPDGFFVIINGGATTFTNILDPFTMAVTQGPGLTVPMGAGGLNIRRPDGRILIVGSTTTATNIYDAALNAFVVGPVLTTGNVAAGSTAVQMPSGRWWIKTAAAVSQIYDPYLGTFIVGPTANGTINAGALTVPRPDGKFVYFSGSTATVIDPALTGAGVTLTAPPCTLAAGSNVFQRSSGEYVVLCGNGASTFIVDAGWNMGGTYTSEQIYAPNLSANTVMNWKNSSGLGSINVKYRTAPTAMALGMDSWLQLPDSGSKLTITPGDVWFQVRIDLQGELQDLPGAKTRVWLSEGNGGLAQYYRQIQAPILQYWSLINQKDPSILTLTSAGTNIFRFTADGQAFTSDKGAWNSGGADLAERYTSTQALQAGDVVIGDRYNPQNVMRSTDSYQSNIMGVVSTTPGFVAGAYTPNSYPIALVGRVPVKISNENGEVHSGDYLTSASIPGYAMKATVAGRVLGTALEDFNSSTDSAQLTCPMSGAGNLSTTNCGTIMAFINLTNYNGQNVELVMADKGFTSKDTGGLLTDNGLSSFLNDIEPKNSQILEFLKTLKSDSATLGSQVFTGRLSALDIVSTNIVADMITAKTIRADRIEGLEIFTNQLSRLQDRVSSLDEKSATDSAVLGASSFNLSSDGLATVAADLNVKGNSFIQGALNVLSSITTQNLFVTDFSTFFGNVLFKKDVSIEGRTTFNSDTAGFAIVNKGSDSVEVVFDSEYTNNPIITASIALEKQTDSASQKQLEDAVLNGNISYIITNRSTKGFTIRLNKAAGEDIIFSWVALSIKDAKIQSSNSNKSSVEANPSATKSAAFQSILNLLK